MQVSFCFFLKMGETLPYLYAAGEQVSPGEGSGGA